MANINNLSVPTIVVVLSAWSQDCSLSFWQLLEFSPPEVSCLIAIQVRSENSTSLRFSQYRPRQKFSRSRNAWKLHGKISGEWGGWVATLSRGPSAFAEWRCGLTLSFRSGILPRRMWLGELCPPSPPIACTGEWSRQFHLFRGSPSTSLLLRRRRNGISSCQGLAASQRAQDLNLCHTVRGSEGLLYKIHFSSWYTKKRVRWVSAARLSNKVQCQCASSAALWETFLDLLGILPFSWWGRRTVFLEVPVSADNFRTQFLGFVWKTRIMLVLLRKTRALDHSRSFKL